MTVSDALDRLVIDVGNTRLKWGRLGPDGRIAASTATSTDDPSSWPEALHRLDPESLAVEAAVASVNPQAADQLGRQLTARGVRTIRWYRSAADVPVLHGLDHPEQTGADRALAVLAAVSMAERPGSGLVIQCGTAITVERIGPDGLWQGGAIALGPSLASRVLHSGTAQLPEVAPLRPGEPLPPSWGRSTVPALTAGIVWGAVGTIRELIARQADRLDPPPWLLWTGGDAPWLAPLVTGPHARLAPDLVLTGLSLASGFRIDPLMPNRSGVPRR